MQFYDELHIIDEWYGLGVIHVTFRVVYVQQLLGTEFIAH